MNINPTHPVDRVIALWQTEALLRAHQFDIEKLVATQAEGEEKESIRKWLQNIVDRMKSEGIEASGHLEETLEIVNELQANHNRLMNESEDFRNTLEEMEPIFARFREDAEPAHAREGMEIFFYFNLKRMAQEDSEQISELGKLIGSYLHTISKSTVDAGN